MAVDDPTPLCSVADLTRSFSNDALEQICVEASRACETETTRRFMPFTITESHRAEGIDPDELGVGSGIPLDLNAFLGASYASALGAGSNLVRKVWLKEYAPLYPEMWTYGDIAVRITVSIGGTNPTTPMRGPLPDTGLVFFS
jgi:hypothetical protein